MIATGREPLADQAVLETKYPASRDEMLALERASLNAWPAAMGLWDRDWLLRLTPGAGSRRINSVNIFSSQDIVDADARVGRMIGHFDRHGIEPVFRWTPLFAKPVTDHLLGLGWSLTAQTVVMTRPVAVGEAVRTATTGHPDAVHVRNCDVVPWIEKLTAVDPSAAPAAAVMQRTLDGIVPACNRLVLEAADGQPVACALAVADGTYLGLLLVHVSADRRRRGLGAALLSAAMEFGAQTGARTAWLQVEAANTAALALYAGAGFEQRYRYIYLQRKSGS